MAGRKARIPIALVAAITLAVAGSAAVMGLSALAERALPRAPGEAQALLPPQDDAPAVTIARPVKAQPKARRARPVERETTVVASLPVSVPQQVVTTTVPPVLDEPAGPSKGSGREQKDKQQHVPSEVQPSNSGWSSGPASPPPSEEGEAEPADQPETEPKPTPEPGYEDEEADEDGEYEEFDDEDDEDDDSGSSDDDEGVEAVFVPKRAV